MSIKKFLSITVFLLLCSAAAAFDTPAQTTASATWQVQKYDLNVSLPRDAATRSISVAAVLTLKNVSSSSAGTLTLRISTAADIAAVRIGNATADFSKTEDKVNGATTLQRIAMHVVPVTPGATITAAVDYKLTLKENTALGAVSLAGAQFLPLSFWYPTPNSWFFTRGLDAAPIKISVNGPDGLTVVSAGSGASGSFENAINGQPFFVAGQWDMVDQGGVSVYMPKGTGPEGQKRAAELAALFADARTFVAGVLGNAPNTPLKIVAARRGAGFSSCGTIIVDEAVFRRSKIDSLTAMNIAEAAAKLWLGGSVTATGDGYGIISEGLSRYIATQFIENKFGKDVADVERLRQRTAYAAVSKRDAPMSSVSPIDDFYYGEVVNKGAMVWRLLARRTGAAEFASTIRSTLQSGTVTLAEMRSAFSGQKDLLDYLFDQVTDMNLLVGLPVSANGQTKVALRNSGTIDATVTITATLANGQKIESPTTIRAQSFGEVAFQTPNNVVRVEIDSEKLYPQIEYSDDVAPRETTDTDLLLAVKRSFDKQDYAGAEKTARVVLASMPQHDEVRILLGRSLLAEGRPTEAATEFKTVLDQKLPTSRSIGWALEGLAETAAKADQNAQAINYAELAIQADAEYGASLAARRLRDRLNGTTPIDAGIKDYFAAFDAAAISNRKSDVDALTVSGEVVKFVNGLSGSSEKWQTQVKQVDRLDADNVLVEADLNIKLLTHDPTSGMAVFRLTRVGNAWKMSNVDIFEVN